MTRMYVCLPLGSALWARCLGYALFFLLALGVPLFAQSTPAPPLSFQARIEEAARALASEPRAKRFSLQRRRAMLEFVVGNMLFVAAHELGHAAIGQLELPVLGKEEDAADAFAILSAVKIGTSFSHRVLVEAAQGYFLSERRDKKEGNRFSYYDEHAMSLQRAYQIVCLMVGSDPKKFHDLAEETKLPADRQTSCRGDYINTDWSWDTLLAPYLRGIQPKQKIEVIYGEGKGALELSARSFRKMRFLETLAEHAADRFVWPNPLVMEMKTCGASGARWRPSARKLELCYELAWDFAELYRFYGKD